MNSVDPPNRTRRGEVVIVYAIGLFQGLSLVAFPAAATILTAPTAYGLSKTQYGLMFLPQVLMAIAGSLALPKLARRWPLKVILVAGLIANAASMALLAASDALQSGGSAYPVLLLATALLGLGFGLTLGSISTYAGLFMPDRREVALTALNVLLGLGTALSPLLVAIFVDYAKWWYLPLLSVVGFVVLLAIVLVSDMPGPDEMTGSRRARLPVLFWLFAGALVLYGIAETMFGNWGTTLLVGHGVKPTSANEALAAFWLGVTLGRLGIALLSLRVQSTKIYLVLPWLIAAALLLAPAATGAGAGIGVFLCGGLACSGFFPMTIGYGESTFPDTVELATGWLIASYQVGYGLAAFGSGPVQKVLSLSTTFRAVAVLAVVMGLLAIRVAQRQVPGTALRAPKPTAPT